jgi:hypothetical protein
MSTDRVSRGPKPLARAKSWHPPLWETADAGALQALARGEALPHQQQRALDFIIKSLAGTYDMSYRPESDRDTSFAEGRRFVGLQVVKLLNLKLENLPND